ncbi:MAG TPA: ribosome maturation factor RimM [Actinomycetota bacterium]|nr:ribosome maturation factor RimM [Actinomycetota bacterium]
MDEPTVAVGRITRAHGVHGEVAVLVISEVPERFRDGATVWTERGRALTVSASRSHGDRLLVRFEGLGDREQADALRGTLLVVPESASPALPEGSWWDHQIVGCAVETDAGRALGTVRDVIHTAANDVWSVVDTAETETLIPVIADVIVEVDVAGRRIVAREVPGLTAPE